MQEVEGLASSYGAVRRRQQQQQQQQQRAARASSGSTASPAAAAATATGAAPDGGGVPLSVALSRGHPARCDGVRLSAVSCQVAAIDAARLPPAALSAAVVHLSGNRLATLRGAEAFASLRVLSAAHNLVADVEGVAPLAACARLEALSLEGNPLARGAAPNYRAHVIALLPTLRELDGRAVTPAERAAAAAAVRAEAAGLAVMLGNACLVHKLAHAARVLRLHAELRRALRGAAGAGAALAAAPAAGGDVLRLLQLWDYEGGLSDAVSN